MLYRSVDQVMDSLSAKRAALDARERRLIAQHHALENKEESLLTLQSEILAKRDAWEDEQAEVRRRAIAAASAPVFPDSGPLHLRPDPRSARNAVEFVRCLMALKAWAGNIPLRDIAERSGGRISASSVRNVLTSVTLPARLDTVDAIVQGCGGDVEQRKAFASAWRRLYMGSTDSTIIDMTAEPDEFQ